MFREVDETADVLRSRYKLSERATWEELEDICWAENIRVRMFQTLTRPGYCWITRFGPLICLRAGVPASVLAHELYHALVADRSGYGLVYTYPDYPTSDQRELAAHRFAELLCGLGSLPL